VLGPIRNSGTPVVDYHADYPGYHFGESMEMVVRDPGLAIAVKVEYFGSNFQQTARMVLERVEHCFLFAKHMLEKDRCPPESRPVPVLDRCRLWIVPGVTAQSQPDAEVRH
jgi:hypothetical protein